MSRGKPWTTEENELIERMIAEGASVAGVKERLPNRTFRAVENQIHRLDLRLGHSGGDSKKILFPEISADKMIEREYALKILAGAIERLRKGGEIEKAELLRLKTIKALIQGYIETYDSYDKYAVIEERFKRLEKIVQAIQKTEEDFPEGAR
jgi:hypothetical protein